MSNKSLLEDTNQTKMSRIIYSQKDEYDLILSKIKDISFLRELYLAIMEKDSKDVLRKKVEKRIVDLGGEIR